MTRDGIQSAANRATLNALHLLPHGVYRWLRQIPITRVIGRRLLDLSRLGENFTNTEILGGPLKGSTFRLQPRTHKEMVIGAYEAHLEPPIKEALKDGYIVFDVGAHVGYFSLLMAKCVGPRGKVVAFEPNPEVMTVLIENKEMNSSDTVIVPVESAMSAFPGQAQFQRGSDSSTGHLVGDDESDLTVSVTTLDEAASVFGRPNFAKIDVEGSELDVLRGAESILKSRKTVFLIEAHSVELSERCQALLDKFRYGCRLINALGSNAVHIHARPNSGRTGRSGSADL